MFEGSVERVKVSHVKDPTNFYVQQVSNNRYLAEIEADIAKYIETNPPPPEEIVLSK